MSFFIFAAPLDFADVGGGDLLPFDNYKQRTGASSPLGEAEGPVPYMVTSVNKNNKTDKELKNTVQRFNLILTRFH
ncbi:MAG: hypothetical protein V1933_04235, partial [Candidatus Omnitrophota bacterium]